MQAAEGLHHHEGSQHNEAEEHVRHGHEEGEGEACMGTGWHHSEGTALIALDVWDGRRMISYQTAIQLGNFLKTYNWTLLTGRVLNITFWYQKNT